MRLRACVRARAMPQAFAWRRFLPQATLLDAPAGVPVPRQDVFVSAEGWQTPGINHPAIALHSPFLDLILALVRAPLAAARGAGGVRGRRAAPARRTAREAGLTCARLPQDTCASYRRHMGDFKHPWLQCVISCLIGTFGGTTVAMLTLGVNPGWMGNIGSPVTLRRRAPERYAGARMHCRPVRTCNLHPRGGFY